MGKVLILGENGQLGRALRRMPQFAHAAFMGREGADFARPETLAAALESHSFDVLINAAAYTAVDRAEEEESLAHRINAESPAALAEICQSRGAVIIHLSTDYVFGPTGAEPLAEDHATAPVNAYGRTKLDGELAVRGKCARHVILRTAWLYGREGHNFVRTMLRLGRSGREIKVVYDQVGAPTYVDDLAAAIAQIVDAVSGRTDKKYYGTYHFANEGVSSWFDVAHAIFEMRDMDVDLRAVRSAEFPAPAVRPAYSVLDKTKIRNTFGLEIRHWRDALRDCLDGMEINEMT